MSRTGIEIDGLVLRRGGSTVLEVRQFVATGGELVAILGPNGAGKSSLLAALAGLLAPASGSVRLGGEPIEAIGREALARRIAWLPQAPRAAWAITLRELASLGRMPWRDDDRDGAVDRALEACGVVALADRRVDAVSGGEARRAHLARVLATGAELLLLDEPVADLDPLARLLLLDLLAEEASRGALVLVVLHDLDLALRWASRVLVLGGGHLLADGPPAVALTDAVIDAAFGMRLEPASGARLVRRR